MLFVAFSISASIIFMLSIINYCLPFRKANVLSAQYNKTSFFCSIKRSTSSTKYSSTLYKCHELYLYHYHTAISRSFSFANVQCENRLATFLRHTTTSMTASGTTSNFSQKSQTVDDIQRQFFIVAHSNSCCSASARIQLNAKPFIAMQRDGSLVRKVTTSNGHQSETSLVTVRITFTIKVNSRNGEHSDH